MSRPLLRTKPLPKPTPTWSNKISVNRNYVKYLEVFFQVNVLVIIVCRGGCRPRERLVKASERDIMRRTCLFKHYNDIIMSTIAPQITSLRIVYSTVSSDADQRIYQRSASLAFVRGIHRRPVNSPHKWPVTRKMFPFDDVIMLFPFGWSQITHFQSWKMRMITVSAFLCMGVFYFLRELCGKHIYIYGTSIRRDNMHDTNMLCHL